MPFACLPFEGKKEEKGKFLETRVEIRSYIFTQPFIIGKVKVKIMCLL